MTPTSQARISREVDWQIWRDCFGRSTLSKDVGSCNVIKQIWTFRTALRRPLLVGVLVGMPWGHVCFQTS